MSLMESVATAARKRVFRKVYSVETREKIQELERKIMQVCVACPHAKWMTGHFECTVKRSHCHSKRVRRWLAEIERLEGNGTRKS